MSADISSARLPRGSRGWRAFVESLTQVDDTAEAHWLEMKSEIELSRIGAAKIAKFILAAANRQPDVASRVLEGYAVMVLGVSPGSLRGVDRIEDIELEKRLIPFLGAQGPQWETQRVPVDDGRDVLVMIVDPPKPGDPIFVCRKDGEGVRDGEVFVRAKGETRRANSGEMDLLRAREKGSRPNVELEVSVAGPVRAYTCDPNLLDEYVDDCRRRLLDRLPKPPPRSRSVAGDSILPGASMASIIRSTNMLAMAQALTTPEDRTEDAFREDVDVWAAVCRRSLGGLVDGFISRKAAPSTFAIRNLTDQYLADVRLDLHLAGAVEQVEADDRDSFVAHAFLPRQPRAWGPRQTDFGFGGQPPMSMYTQGLGALRPAGGPRATFRNGGSVDVCLELPELRPRGVEEFSGEVVLVVRDPAMTVVEGQWTATAREIHAVFEGAFVARVDAPIDLTDRLRATLTARESA